MVKKILFTIAVVAFLAGSVQAVDPGDSSIKDDGTWPYEYIFVDICTIPIKIDVGYFVQLEDCGDYKIQLQQVECESIDRNNTKDFPCYDGCVLIEIRANFQVQMGGDVDETISPQWWKDGDNDVYYGDCGQGCAPSIVEGDGEWHEKKVCVKAWDIKIWDAAGQQGENEFHVADLVVTVKPTQG